MSNVSFTVACSPTIELRYSALPDGLRVDVNTAWFMRENPEEQSLLSTQSDSPGFDEATASAIATEGLSSEERRIVRGPNGTPLLNKILLYNI